MASHDKELFKDKIEVSLDGRQIFYLFFGGAVIATLVFVLGVMVGRRVEARAVVETGSPATDPLAALDRLEQNENSLAFPTALRGGNVTLGSVDATVGKRKPLPAVGGPLLPVKKPEPKAHEEGKGESESKNVKATKVEAELDKDAKDKPKAPKAKRKFTLQVGSFQNKDEADSFFRQLAGSSYEPYMVETELPGKGTYYRVRVGGYASYKEALDAKAKFEDHQHVIAYVTHLK